MGTEDKSTSPEIALERLESDLERKVDLKRRNSTSNILHDKGWVMEPLHVTEAKIEEMARQPVH